MQNYRLCLSVLLLALLTISCASPKPIEPSKEATKGVATLSNTPERIDIEKVPETAKKYVIEGAKLQMSGKFAEAILEYQQAAELDSNAEIYYAIANCYYKMQKIRLSIDYSRKAIRLRPDWLEPYNLLVSSYLSNYDLKSAISTIESSMALDSSTERKLWLARILEFDNMDRAIDIYENAYAETNNTEILQRLNYLYLQNNQKEDYLKSLLILYEEDPTDSSIIAPILAYYLENAEFDNILKFLDKLDKSLAINDLIYIYNELAYEAYKEGNSSTLDFKYSIAERFDNRFDNDILSNLSAGTLYLSIDKFEKAEEKMNRALMIGDTNSLLPLSVAATYNIYKFYQKAADICNKYIGIYPDTLGYYLTASNAYYAMKQYKEAALQIDNAIERFGDRIDLLVQSAGIYEKLGDFEKVFEIYNKAIQLDSNDPMLNNNYAYTLSENGGDLQKALAMANKAISAEPENPYYLDTFGWIKFRLGELEMAEKYVLKSLKYLEAAEMYEHLGDIYEAMNKIEDAVKNWQNAIELEPERDNIREKLEKYVNK